MMVKEREKDEALSVYNDSVKRFEDVAEKLYESLVNREEMIKAEDMNYYYRIPADNRDLNYNQFFSEGQVDMTTVEEYNSHNTQRLDVEGTKQLLLKLDIIKDDLNN